jgi:hypothetical protein
VRKWTEHRASNSRPKHKKPAPRSGLYEELCRRSPNLPHTFACSTIGPARLNFRVRDGNGWDPRSMVTGKPGRLHLLRASLKPERRLAGCFSRSLIWSNGQFLPDKDEAIWRHINFMNLKRNRLACYKACVECLAARQYCAELILWTSRTGD